VNEITEEEFLLSVKCEQINKFYLHNPVLVNLQPTEKNITDLSNKIWYVIKHEASIAGPQPTQAVLNTNEEYTLVKNDIVKLGRVKYALNELSLPNLQCQMDAESTEDKINGINVGTKPVFDFIFKTHTAQENSTEDICKICLTTTNEERNPLVSLCKCTGGIRFSHYDCIKMWMQTKLSQKGNESNTVTSYNIKSFNCEICKTPYPFRFRIENKEHIYDLIDIVRPEGKNYIILESLNQMKDNNNVKSIHVIILDGNTVSIGRGHESDVRVNDISVSRLHACLNFNPVTGKISIRDYKSKFGTLVLFKNQVMVTEKKMQLQIGRTFVDANLMTYQEYEKINNKKILGENCNLEIESFEERLKKEIDRTKQFRK